MKKYQNVLLAGVAALAIATSAGIASAQTRGGESPSGSAASSGGQTSATQATPSTPDESGGMSQHPGAGMEHGGKGSGGTGSDMRSQAQKHPGAAVQKGESSSQKNAQGASQEHPGKRQAQNPDQGMKGQKSGTAAEGSAPANGTREGANVRPESSGANGTREGANVAPESGGVKFSERQRTTIKRTIIDSSHAPKVGHVDFDVRVGTVIPHGSIHITTVPETLVRIEPRWRGYLYFVYEDEIVVVNPRDMRIVAVVAV